MSTDKAPLPEAVRAQIERKFHFHFEGYRRLVTEIAQEAYRLGSAAAAQQERARLEAEVEAISEELRSTHRVYRARIKELESKVASHPPPTPEDR